MTTETTEERGPELPGLQFQRKLGSGGFSDVYLYERDQPRMKVAVKVLKADVIDDAQRTQFMAEADTMGELAEHPYIVPVLSTGMAADGRPYLEMRYYPGSDLADRVRAQPLSVPEALRMGIQLASAIETAHRAGIIHRDIKPQNVLISSYGVPGLTDFGIAGRGGDTDEDDANVGVSMPWSPPEVLTGASNGSRASDVYSLGATIWNLLVGRSPFSIPSGDNSQRALFSRIVHSKPPMTGRADVPSSLERLLSQAMSKKPEHRPQTAMELARHLQRVEQELRLARTEIVVLEARHDGIDPDQPPHSNTPSATPTYTLPETAPGDAAKTTFRVPLRPDAPGDKPAPPKVETGGAAPTTQRPVRATTGPSPAAAPTTQRPVRATTGPAPAVPAAPAAPADSGAAPTTHRPVRASAPVGAAPTTHRPTRAGQPPAAPPADAEAPSGFGRWAAIGAVVALLLVIVGTGAFLSRGGGNEEPDTTGETTAAPGASDPADVVQQDLLPSIPEVAVGKVTAKQVAFSWAIEQKGDLFVYRAVDRAGKPLGTGHTIKVPRVTITRAAKGQTCIQVFARRGSKSSTSYGQACAPAPGAR